MHYVLFVGGLELLVRGLVRTLCRPGASLVRCDLACQVAFRKTINHERPCTLNITPMAMDDHRKSYPTYPTYPTLFDNMFGSMLPVSTRRVPETGGEYRLWAGEALKSSRNK
jgi:hypothetical protein